MSDDEEEKLDGELAGLVYVPTPCPQCGAVTEDEAGKICKQTQGMDGDYHCAGEFKNGMSVQPTAESIAEMNRWIDQQVAKDEAATRRAERDGENSCGSDSALD